ncbi:MAG TPA: pyridoxal phosphate-dependent aminotransferase [Steroidobacter sp.]|uniref:pyridoxal phosphate-dependent aminotransferase n=1 Tax=Steroidobacter sp. TaxID=1978227 RepID=UPI002EDB6099
MQEESVRPPAPPSSEPARSKSGRPATRAPADDVFANPDYVGWYRELSALLTAGEKGRLLFDSTILEPTAQLYSRARQAFDAGQPSPFRSTFGWGSPLLIAAIAKRYGVDERSILTTTGCTGAIWHVYTAYLKAGAHVIIERPYFELLPRFAKSRGASISFLPRLEPGHGVDLEQLEALIQPNTELIVLTNAHNPTGAYLDDAALRDIARVANKHGVAVLVDEVYGDFVPSNVRSGPAARIDPCFISVSSLTKVYGLHGLKCGWLIAADDVLQRLRPVYAEFEIGSSKITHGIAALILDDIAEFGAHWRSVLARNRPLLVETVRRLQAEGLMAGAVPEYGCMYFPRLTQVKDTRRFASWMWERSRLGLAPGDFFGAPGHIRLGFGQSHQELAAGLALLADGLREYREPPVS